MSDEPNKLTVYIRGADIEPFYFDITELTEFKEIMENPDTLIKHVLDEMPDGNARQKKLKQELSKAYGTEQFELDKLTDELLTKSDISTPDRAKKLKNLKNKILESKKSFKIDVDDAKKRLEKSEKEMPVAEKLVTDAEKKKSDAESKMTDTSSTAKHKQAEYDAAKKVADNANEAAAKAKKEMDTAVATANAPGAHTGSESNSQAAIKKSQEADKEAKDANKTVNLAKHAAEKATKDAAAAKTVFDKATHAYEKAQKRLETVQAEKNKAQAEYDNASTKVTALVASETSGGAATTKGDDKRVRLYYRKKIIVENNTASKYVNPKTKDIIAIDISDVTKNYIDNIQATKTKPTPTEQLRNDTIYLTMVIVKPKEYNRHSAKFVFMKNRVKYPDTLTGHVSSPFIRLSNFIIEEYKPRPFTLDWFEQNMHDIDEKIYLTELARFGDMDIPKKVINVSVDGYKRAADLFPSSGGTRKNKPYSSRRVTRRR
jgi:hypothetical protein